MISKILQCTFFALLFSDIGSTSNCETQQYTWTDEYNKIVCYNVTSDMVLDFKSNTIVKALSIDRNSVVEKLASNTSLSKLTELEKLTLQSLQIEEVLPGAFYGLDKLETLNLRENRITDFPQNVFSNLENLKYLHLQQNSLKQISVGVFNNLKSLESLYLSDNLISKIEDNALTGLDNLIRLSLNRNNLTVLQDNVFEKLIELQRIDLSENPLKEIGNVGFSQNLDSVLIDRTLLKEWKMNISHLTIRTFSLEKNYLEEFDFSTLSASERYSHIELSENNISVVYNLENTNFTFVHISNNLLTELKGFSEAIRTLNLKNNKIKHVTEIPDTENYSIWNLHLSHNEIETASCLGLSTLRNLELDNNQITVIKQNNFKGCPNLYSLDLSYNKIEYIEDAAFENLKSLSDLDLSNNKISAFDYTSFSGLNELTSLYFDNNGINTFDVDELVRQIPKLERIKFDSASLFCDDLHNIFHSLRIHHIYAPNDVYITNVECKKRG